MTSSPRQPQLSGDPDYRGRHRSRDWVDTGTLTADEVAEQRARVESTSGLSSYVVSHLRTLVPLLWGAGITWLAERYVPGIPRELATDPTVLAGATSAVTFLWYALWRWLEPRVPAAFAAILLGHPAEPHYPD